MNRTSIYKEIVFNTIFKGVFHYLTLLIIFDDRNSKKTVDNLHLVYVKVLKLGSLIKDNFLTLSECKRVGKD